jgi:ABC-type anion transport system duplicated permease subunit
MGRVQETKEFGLNIVAENLSLIALSLILALQMIIQHYTIKALTEKIDTIGNEAVKDFIRRRSVPAQRGTDSSSQFCGSRSNSREAEIERNKRERGHAKVGSY